MYRCRACTSRFETRSTISYHIFANPPEYLQQHGFLLVHVQYSIDKPKCPEMCSWLVYLLPQHFKVNMSLALPRVTMRSMLAGHMGLHWATVFCLQACLPGNKWEPTDLIRAGLSKLSGYLGFWQQTQGTTNR